MTAPTFHKEGDEGARLAPVDMLLDGVVQRQPLDVKGELADFRPMVALAPGRTHLYMVTSCGANVLHSASVSLATQRSARATSLRSTSWLYLQPELKRV
jgi:hypothetical protein